MPSPQVVMHVSLFVPEQVYPYSMVQALEHPLPSNWAPSSHCSVSGFKRPFPQVDVQSDFGGVEVQAYPASVKQDELQPSPPVELPSSQVSVPSISSFPQI